MSIKFVQNQSTTLAGSGALLGDVTLTLKSFTDLNGNLLTMSDFGTKGEGTIEPGTLGYEESIYWTGITQNANGTATLTGVKSVIGKSPYTETSGLTVTHNGGVTFVVTNTAGFYDQLAVKSNDETITGQWTFDVFPITPATPDASTTTKGMVKMSVAPASATNPIAVGDNDPRIASSLTADEKAALAGSQGVPNTANPYVTKDNVYTANTDQTQATQNSTVEFGMADTTGNKNKIQQSFIPVKTKNRGVLLYKAADTGTFTGTVTITLQADTAGSPSGSVLATQTITNAQWLALAVGEFEVDFTAEYDSQIAGNLYWIVASASTADTSNHPNLGTNTAGGYANGSVKYWNTTDGYVAVANIDLYFKTLQGVSSQISYIPINTIQRVYTPNIKGSVTTQFTITNTSGTTFRYTWNTTGTDPAITAVTYPVNSFVEIQSSVMNVGNRGLFTITGSGPNYFEVTNAAGVAESNKALTGGFLALGQKWTKPAGLKQLRIQVVSGGSGGSGGGSISSYGGAAGISQFGNYSKSTGASSYLGGIASLGTINANGGGSSIPTVQSESATPGGNSFFGGGGAAVYGTTSVSGTLGGGGGGGYNSSSGSGIKGGGGGGAGAYSENLVNATTLNSYEQYIVGVGGTAGNGNADYGAGAGGDGVIIVTEYYY